MGALIAPPQGGASHGPRSPWSTKIANDHWALLTIDYVQIVGGYRVTTTTSAPCHNWLRYSVRQPRKHRRADIERGLRKMGDIYLCFVVFTDIEQNEAGDTTTHTFNLNIFNVTTHKYQAVWFYFWAEVGGIKSPSETCLFLKAYERLYENYWPAWDSALGLEIPHRAAQGFTTSYPHRVSKVEVYLTHRGVPCTLQFSIHRADVDYHPLEPPLGYGLYVFPNNDPGWIWRIPTIYLNTPVPINVYKFCIVGHGITGGAYNAQWRGTTAGVYPGGIASRSAWPAPWVTVAGFDLNFEEWGYPKE